MYAKGSSDIIAKLRGTYNTTATAPAPGVSTELQKSIFNAPPSAVVSASTTVKPVASESQPTSEGQQGVKRPREEDESEGEAPMEEDDSDVSMEASSDED